VKLFFKQHYQETVIFFLFFTAALVIVGLHLLFHPIRVLDMDTSIFYMDEKYTLAAFFSTVTAFLVGWLALTNVSAIKSKFGRLASYAYGLFFMVLAFDEYFEVHEYINTVIKAGFKQEGILKTAANFSWVFPLALIILAVFALLVVKIRLVNKTIRFPFIAGAFCFGLVLVLELAGSAAYGQDIYVYLIALEEGLEMTGVSFFLLAALVDNKNSLN
jgi:hypothetical protein